MSRGFHTQVVAGNTAPRKGAEVFGNNAVPTSGGGGTPFITVTSRACQPACSEENKLKTSRFSSPCCVFPCQSSRWLNAADR